MFGSSCASTYWRRRSCSRGTSGRKGEASRSSYPGSSHTQADQVTPPDGHTAANAVEILDSEDELVQEMQLTPERRRRLREQLQSWRSSSSD